MIGIDFVKMTMKQWIVTMACLLLVVACGQSYEETKRITREQRREAARRDSAALKVAVMPTMDCLPMFVAAHYELFDTLYGGVRLKQYKAHLSCSDLQRAQNTGLTESVPLRTTRVPEPEWLRPGKCIQPRADLRQFPAEQPRA